MIIEAHFINQPDSEGESGRRRLSLKVMQELAPSLLPAELRSNWQQLSVWLEQCDVPITIEEYLEDEFLFYLETHKISPSEWVYTMEQAVPKAREVLAKVFAIAEKVLLGGNDGAEMPKSSAPYGDS